MKKLFGVLLVASLLLASSRSANAATTFSGAFLVLEGYIGGNIRFGYPVYRYTRANIQYMLEQADLRNVTSNAAKSIQEIIA